MPRDSRSIEPDARIVTALTRVASDMGADIVDIAGFLDEVEHKSNLQVGSLHVLQSRAIDMVDRNSAVSIAIGQVSETSDQTLKTVENSIDRLRDTANSSEAVASWVGAVEARMGELVQTLGSVTTTTTEIAKIARQVNILAINAKIEASRAGDTGRGFAVVAEAINDLSTQTGQAARQISDSISALTDQVTDLKSEAETVGGTAKTVLETSDDADRALNDIADNVRESAKIAGDIEVQASALRTAIDTFSPALTDIQNATVETAHGIEDARKRVNGLIDFSEAILQNSVQLGGTSTDTPFIDHIMVLGQTVCDVFAKGIASGQISREALFSQTYTPIPGTNPQQFMAPFTEFADAVLPATLESALQFDRRIVFCAAVDVNGYLPTHNRKFSAPQGTDPHWNARHCRNRRVFNDRVGLKAGQSQEPFLLQTYRRNMGGGEFVIVKDLSTPITVEGQHWGGLRLGYRL
ncbi:methyl-accepting chemotaxis protein [Actibacterium sp. 188UL27-1]|uniref:methyl-accepting chemotaxis protein n=1 Tax=Actibacterium sp. 188UL27-1 TaxID=2786961 RepID=UPI00195EEBCD|nr:methyl-accepting chemotaxis protein [Actibacterium sp. 188UL27-1]MBM7067699.1 chemotaxis protein [Actibacterium sp. 188UL27-1]